jgi:protein tyrosine phosphatase (PTP) superfamily phosphohydrolase (DUF442 family)
VLNCDETRGKLHPSGVLVYAETGTRNVAILAMEDEQGAIPVMAIVTVGSRKLPLYILENEVTNRDETSRLEAPGADASGHSRTGWMTMHMMMQFEW